jgi:integrase
MRRHIGERERTSHFWRHSSNQVSGEPGAVQRRVRHSNRTTCHSFRPSFATHLREVGYDVRTVRDLLGYRGGRGVRSPLDALDRQR